MPRRDPRALLASAAIGAVRGMRRLPWARRIVAAGIGATPLARVRRDRLLIRVFGKDSPEAMRASMRQRPYPFSAVDLRARVIADGLAVLRWVTRSRLAAAALWFILNRAPVSADMLAKLEVAIGAGASDSPRISGVALVNLGVLGRASPAPIGDLRRGSRGAAGQLQDTVERLSASAEIHLFLEESAAIPRAMFDERLGKCRFVVYSFEDRASEFARSGLAGRVRMAPLRDQFPEISPEAEQLHLFSRSLAGLSMTALFSRFADGAEPALHRRSAVLAQGLEDDLAWKLSLLECYRCAIAAVPNDAPVVFVASSTRFVPNGLPLILTQIEAGRLYVGISRRAGSRIRQFWTGVGAHLRNFAAEESSDVPTEPPSAAAGPERPAVQVEFDRLRQKLSQAGARGDGFGARIAAERGGSGAILVAYAEASTAYVETAAALGIHLAATQTHSPLVLSCTVAGSSEVAAALSVSEIGAANLRNLAPLAPLLFTARPLSAPAFLAALTRLLGSATIYDGTPLSEFLVPQIADFLGGKLHVAEAAYHLGNRLAQSANLHGALTCPGRHWLVRAVAAGLCDGGRVPVVDVQALNVLNHAKYLAPIADYAAVIDTTSAEIYQRALGFPADRITVTGTPRNDVFRARVAGVGRAHIAAQLRLDPHCTRRILLASQLQPFERMGKIARALADVVASDPGVELLVKLHPREGDGREQSYRAIFDAAGISPRVAINRSLQPFEAIGASDLCVTIYSNMAREAAMAGKPVVLALFTGWEPPIRLDAEELALGAFSATEFIRLIRAALDAFVEPGAAPHALGAYFERNAHLLTGNALDAIMGIIEKHRATAAPLASTRLGPGNARPDAVWNDIIGRAQVNLVLEDTVALGDLPPGLPDNASVEIFSNLSAAAHGPLPAQARLQSGRFNARNRPSVEAAVAKANALAETCTEAILDVCAGSAIGAELARLRYAVWMRLRPSLIDSERKAANLAQGLDAAAATIVVVGRSDCFLREMAAMALSRGVAATLLMRIENDLSVSVFELRAFVRQRIPGVRTWASATAREAWAKSSQSRLAAALADLDAWHSRLLVTRFEAPAPPMVVLCTAWHLKTVAPAVAPVLGALPPGTGTLAFDLSDAGAAELGTSLRASNRRGIGTPPSVFGPAAFNAMLPQRPIAARMVAAVTERVLQTLGLDDADTATGAAVASSVADFARVWIWEMLGWSAFCQQVFARGASVSLACPGRQWHAEIAHIRAAEAGALSVTLQNAYMTGGYSYTRPTGELVTAIDAWSRDVFIAAYNVPAETVEITSTPRFDYLAGLGALSRDEACAALDLDPATGIVLFAVQEGLDDEAETIVRALASLPPFERRMLHVVKLHPRSPPALQQRLQHAIDAIAGPHDMRIVQDWPIAQALAASDVVITVYSNVGIEAAILGKSLVVAKFAAEDLPLPLDRFDIGCVVASPDELQQAVRRFFDDEEFIADIRHRQKRYVAANPLMAEGGSARLIASRIAAGLTRPADSARHRAGANGCVDVG